VTSFKAMTYNLRCSVANDGPDAWPHRKQALLDLIQRHDPDLLGVQEAMPDQMAALRSALSSHDVLGVGREDGIIDGEHSAIFYRRGLLGLREGGTKWISAEPNLPGSLAFDARITRVFTWAEFFVVGCGAKTILVMNTHLDHESAGAQQLGAEQLHAFAEKRKLPTVMMGDFNVSGRSAPIQFLVAKGYRDNKPVRGPYGTFNAFRPESMTSDMIDHILTSPEWEVDRVEIDRTLYEMGQAPSDHFPLVARLSL
jgi:endonuclease/exonuclease/phosphatase family metal-dependent hydrolase